jgi:hypothetical protein
MSEAENAQFLWDFFVSSFCCTKPLKIGGGGQRRIFHSLVHVFRGIQYFPLEISASISTSLTPFDIPNQLVLHVCLTAVSPFPTTVYRVRKVKGKTIPVTGR